MIQERKPLAYVDVYVPDDESMDKIYCLANAVPNIPINANSVLLINAGTEGYIRMEYIPEQGISVNDFASVNYTPAKIAHVKLNEVLYLLSGTPVSGSGVGVNRKFRFTKAGSVTLNGKQGQKLI